MADPIRKNVAETENGARANPKAKYLNKYFMLVIGFKLIALSSHVVFKILKYINEEYRLHVLSRNE